MSLGEDTDRAYNKVLDHFTGEPGSEIDLVGLIAYALYKRQKRDWLIRHRSENSGQSPSPAEVAAITNNYLNNDVRDTLRERATDMLSNYAETYVEALEPEIREDAISNETLRQAQAIKQSIEADSGFLRQVGTGLVATAIWTLLVTALILTAYALGSDFIDAWLAVPN